MKVLFCVLSATGNTLKVSEGLAARLRERGFETAFYNVRKGDPMPETAGYDEFVFAYPVHAFNAPATMLRFLKKFPKGDKPAYLVRSSGEPLRLNDASGITPRRILKRKGYDVRGEFGYVMPYNIIFRHSDGMAARMWQAANLRFGEDAAAIAENRACIRKVGPFRRAVAFTLRIEHPAMPVVGLGFHAKKKLCVGCGLCATVCPQKNITMKKGRPKFGNHCVGCMACAFACPKDAVRTSLLNGWRVNGKYSFEGDPATDEEVCRYCRKAYLRYFHAAEHK